jgi:hypothetical protein
MSYSVTCPECEATCRVYQSEILIPSRRAAMLVPGDAVSSDLHAPDARYRLFKEDVLDVIDPVQCPSRSGGASPRKKAKKGKKRQD